MPEFRFVPECHADTTLIRFLTNNSPQIIHASGYSDVGRIMNKAPFNTLMVGFVDDDKRIPPYFDDFEILNEGGKVIFKKKVGVENYLIVIQKAIETFLVWNAEQVEVELDKFGFPNDIKQLGNRLKSLQIEKDEDFQNLLTVLNTKNAPGFVRIRTLLNDLIGEKLSIALL